MEEDATRFRFLTNEEFVALDVREKAAYLGLASKQLETCQKELREQFILLVRETTPKAL